MRGALILALIPLLTSPAANAASSGDKPNRFEVLKEDIAAGRWQEAVALAETLVPEMARLAPVAAPEPRRQVAVALRMWAVAELNLGREDDAAWHWQTALNLEPKLTSTPFAGSYGEAGDWLEHHRLRTAASWPQGEAAAARAVDPPMPITVPVTVPPLMSQWDWAKKRLDVEVMIDADGRVRWPVVLAGSDFPAKVYFGLDLLREWRFRPARTAAGEPVAALYRLREFVGPHPRTFYLASDETTQPIHRLFLAGRWREAGEAVEPLIWPCIAQDDLSECHPTSFLFFQALAAAGAGDVEEALWSWHLADVMGSSFTVGDLALYDRTLPRIFAERARPCPVNPHCAAPRAYDPGIQPPVAISSPRVALSPKPATELGTDRLIATVVVGADGRVSDPFLEAGHSLVTGYLALQTLRRWRFEPARRDGESVAVRLTLTVPVEPSVAAEEVARWEEGMEWIESALLDGDSRSARDEAVRLIAEIAAATVDGGSDLLARALLQLALAEAGTGDEELAVWHWQTAQNLAVEYRLRDLGGYGQAGELLDRHRLRRPAEEPASADTDADTDADIIEAALAPRRMVGRQPDYPTVLADLPDTAVVEVIVDPDGRPHSPLVLRGRSPAGLFSVLEGLRNWRFAPHPEGPVRQRISFDLTPVPTRPLHRFDSPRQIRELIELARREVDPDVARCYRQSGYADPPPEPLRDEDLRSGEAFEVLENGQALTEDRWRLEDAEAPAEKQSRRARAAHPLLRPSRLFMPQPSYSDAARRERISGTVPFQIHVNKEGKVEQVTILRSLHPDLDLSTLEVVCRSRFEPATRDGVPVAVYFNWVTNFRLQ